ncbi:MAG: drug/metabolite transporter (DMT)-like permease [Yoonia sp.]|jgi:drug/metabolite transporter (DMT)-like permease
MQPTLRAALWMVGAIFAFTSMAIAGRAASLELDTFEIMLYRSCVGFTIVLVVGKAFGTLGQVRLAHIGLHTARNLAHFSGQNLWFFAITVIPLAQVFALEFTTPIWVIMLSPLILRERITPLGAISAVIGFVGILIVARPGATTISPGIIAAALCAIAFAFTAIFTRKLTRTETITCILFFLTGMQAIFGLVAAGYDGDIALPSLATLPWVIAIGFAGLIAHFCLTTALSIAPATVVMPMDFARLPIIAVVGIMLYAEPIDAFVILGGVLIFGANYVNIRFGQSKTTK